MTKDKVTTHTDQVDALANSYAALLTEQQRILAKMTDTAAKKNAQFYIETSILWMEKAFTATKMHAQNLDASLNGAEASDK